MEYSQTRWDSSEAVLMLFDLFTTVPSPEQRGSRAEPFQMPTRSPIAGIRRAHPHPPIPSFIAGQILSQEDLVLVCELRCS